MPGGQVAVALSGEIDIVTAPAVRDVLAEAVRRAVTGVVVDLGEVAFLDVAVPARVLRLLTLTGLDRLADVPAPPGSQPQRERADPLAAAT